MHQVLFKKFIIHLFYNNAFMPSMITFIKDITRLDTSNYIVI